MSIRIERIESKKDIKTFIKFQINLYKDNPYYVPPILFDEIDIFLRDKNPAFEVNDINLFIAYIDNIPVGRIASIINHPSNKKYNEKDIRFSWFDSIDDFEVAEALLNTVRDIGMKNNLETMSGPHGFSDLDPQGMLLEGFDRLSTIASFYNHQYYNLFMDKYGFEKEIDFVEYWSTVPPDGTIPEKLIRINEYAQTKYKFTLKNYDKKKDVTNRGNEIFELLEKTFENNYGTVPLTEKQVKYYIKKYLPYVHKDLVKLVENEKGELIGFLITMPSLSKAFRKAGGNLFPFGWYYLLKAMKTYEILDFYFVGVRDDYRGKGVDVLMTTEIARTAIQMGFKNSESNQELETNEKVQSQWKFFNPVMHKRRRIYKKKI